MLRICEIEDVTNLPLLQYMRQYMTKEFTSNEIYENHVRTHKSLIYHVTKHIENVKITHQEHMLNM